MKKMYAQRWEFKIGNSLVIVDNAYDTSGWGKERLIINDETVQSSDGYNRSYQKYEEPWLSHDGDIKITAKLKSHLFYIYCELRTGEKIVQCQSYYEAFWYGEDNSWPEIHQWIMKNSIPGPAKSPKNIFSSTLSRLKFWKRTGAQ